MPLWSLGAGPRDAHAHRHRRRSDARRDSGRHRDRHRPRRRHQSRDGRAGQDVRRWRRDAGRTQTWPLRDRGGVSRVSDRCAQDVRVRAGDNKHVIVLALETLQDSVTVGRDAQETAADRQSTFGSALTREQVDALSDDPNEMARQLQEIAGSDAVLRVDSFRGRETALEGADQVDSHHPRRVRCREPQRRRALHRYHHAAGHRAAARRHPLQSARRILQRPQPVHAGQGTRAIAELRLELLRIADQGARLVQRLGQRHRPRTTRRICMPRCRPARGPSADAAQSARQRLHLRQLRLRADQGPDAAHRLQPGRLDRSGTSASARSTCRSTRYTNEEHGRTLRIQEAGPLGRRFFTNTRLSFSTERQQLTVRARDADRSASTTPSRAAAPRWPAGGTRAPSISRRISTTCAACTRCEPASCSAAARTAPTTRRTTSAPTPSRASRRSKPARRAATRGASAIRTSDYWNLQAGAYIQDDIRVRKGLDAQPRPPLRSADASRRLQRVRAARSASPGRRSRAARRRCARARASSTTG